MCQYRDSEENDTCAYKNRHGFRLSKRMHIFARACVTLLRPKRAYLFLQVHTALATRHALLAMVHATFNKAMALIIRVWPYNKRMPRKMSAIRAAKKSHAYLEGHALH